MTDARFPERWLNDRRVLRLPDDAFRLFVVGLAWSVANKTDGYLSDDDLPLLPGVNLACAQLLGDVELWWGHMHGWQITEFEDTQSSRDELNALADRRRADRRRKAAERARKARSADASRDNSRDASRDSHAERVRTGQARPGGTKNEVQVPAGDSIAPAIPSPVSGEAAKEVAPSQSRESTETTTARWPVVHDDQQIPLNGSAGARVTTVTRASVCAAEDCSQPVEGKQPTTRYCSARCKNRETKRRTRAAATAGTP